MAQDPPVMIAYGPCHVHGGIFGFDPDRVTSVLIDPLTGCPPDVDPVTGLPVPVPDPARMARSVKQPVCPDCCRALNNILRGRGQPARFDETDTSGGQVQQ
jgi:hypothetical protein